MGSKRPLAYLGLVCSAVAHVVALVPFIFIWLILRELLGGSVDSGASRDGLGGQSGRDCSIYSSMRWRWC